VVRGGLKGERLRRPKASASARAASFSKLQFLEMRVITDAADQMAGADFQTNLERTMPNLAHLLLKWSFVRQQSNPTHGR